LETLGLIEFQEEGKAKKPTVWYDSISVDIPVVA
jgi:predicted transcriptional regulator